MSPPTLSLLLKARAQEFCERYLPNGKQIGNEWLVGDPYGAPGKSTAVQLTGPKRGLWIDRANPSEHGDLLGLLEIQLGDKIKSYDEARRFLGLPEWKPGQNGNGHVAPPFNPLSMTFTRKGQPPIKPVAAWPYHSSDGQIVAYTCRFQNPDGSKDVIPMRLIDGKWRWKGWTGTEPRPIYNLHHLTRRASDPVLIVEGEKTADAAARIFPKYVVITWQGGSKSVERADLSPLLSRKTQIVLWPDADPPGRSAMTYLKARLPSAVLVKLPPSLPDGWDLADPAPDFISPQGLLDAALNPPAPVPSDSEPFRLLGYDDHAYWYFSCTGQTLAITASSHTEMELQRLAPDGWWAENFPGRQSTDYRAAAKSLIARQHQTGFFNPDIVRGLGCWIDPDPKTSLPRVIYHAGDRLFIDGIETPLSAYRGSFLYPRRRRLDIDLSTPATLEETALLIDLCRRFNWTNHDSSSWILPGLCCAAIVCGALDWRPHGWLTGRRGSGKTWLYGQVIARIIGICLKVQSATTSAGIRQALGSDALAVIFDEIERNHQRAQDRISDIFELARQSSAESGGAILKGTTSGEARTYRIRSTFLFCSISMGSVESADESRITRMDLSRPIQEDWPEIKSLWSKTLLRDDFCARIRARTIRLASVIRQNASTYADAIAQAAGDSRTGQQYGAIAAGFLSLTSDQPISSQDAFQWASSIDWDAFRPDASSEEDDPSRCLDILLQAKIDLQHPDGTRFNSSIGELLRNCQSSNPSNPKFQPSYDALLRSGVHPISHAFDVANRHSALDRIFHGSPYASGWKEHLARLPGADSKNITYKPPGGKFLRATRIPFAILDQ